MEDARLRIGTELRSFARNTLEYIDKEAEQTFGPLELPPLATKFRGRHALVVVRASTTSTICARCAHTCANTARCSSRSTAAPTR